ncbi:MAG: MBL fold metallo-hydrolase [Oscillospiraceae bacterium]|jgi:glyoxylase-like metal-dependent hydrolase (beta-lactamase superfamily II)|nr:MBL fold metallo-hydrolase [Oscillospiraceae bacterium]
MMERYQVLRLVYPEQVLSLAVLAGKDGAVLVDCGYPGSLRQLEEALRGCGVALEELAGLVLTHQDDDHMGAAAELKAVCPRLRIYASAEEAPYIEGVRKNLRLQQAEDLQERLPEEQRAWGEQFCRRLQALRCVPVDVLVHDGDRFDWGGGCEIIATPGHTPGHISLRALDNAYLITGDAAVVENGRLAVANPGFCLNLEAAEQSLRRLEQYQCRRYLCCHGGIYEQEGYV